MIRSSFSSSGLPHSSMVRKAQAPWIRFTGTPEPNTASTAFGVSVVSVVNTVQQSNSGPTTSTIMKKPKKAMASGLRGSRPLACTTPAT